MASTSSHPAPPLAADEINVINLQYGLNSCLIAISTVLVALRLYARARIVRAVGIDDYMALLAWGFCCMQSSLDMYMVLFGPGRHIQNVPPEDLKKFFDLRPILVLTLFWTICVVRLTIAAFLPRLSKNKLYLRLVYAVAGANIVITTVCFFIVLLQCTPVSDLFDSSKPGLQCVPKSREQYVLWAHSVFGVIIDFSLMALPIWIIVTSLTLSRRKAIQVVLVFCVGFASIITGIVRLVLVFTTDMTTDTTFKITLISPWVDTELHVGFWVACFPAIKPLIHRMSYKLGLRSTPHSTDRKATDGARYVKSDGSQRRPSVPRVAALTHTTRSGPNHWLDIEDNIDDTTGWDKSIELDHITSPSSSESHVLRKC